jgi:murein DD-endopeptidase MepM/ murein hydrolase activator NlpD
MERDQYSLIIVGDELSPIRRFDVPKVKVRRAVRAGIVLAVVLAVGLVDYVRLRIDHLELDDLRVETAAQRDKIDRFDEVLAGVEGRLRDLQEFERKVRIIANLPGATGTGGADVVEVGPDEGDLQGPPQGGDDLPPAAGGGAFPPAAHPEQHSSLDASAGPAQLAEAARSQAQRLEQVAGVRAESLEALIEQLESKRDRLESSPSIWPAKGWLTSRFGMRVSPFTNRPQFHAGLDIAGAPGTEVVAPAKGRVAFAGRRGPLGNSVIIDHGYGVRTIYGHNQELKVKRGEPVERGQVIAKLGSTGRSTGPHLHYVVEVDGKARNPLDFIFD